MSELDRLVDVLHTKTLDGKLHWTLNGSSQITLVEGSTLIEFNEAVANRIYSLVLRNKDGIALDSENYNMDSRVVSLFNYVKRKALHVDEAIEHLVKSIERR